MLAHQKSEIKILSLFRSSVCDEKVNEKPPVCLTRYQRHIKEAVSRTRLSFDCLNPVFRCVLKNSTYALSVCTLISSMRYLLAIL